MTSQDSPSRNVFPTPDDAPLPVGFIGLGHMGRIIAKKLLVANNPLIIFDNSLDQHTEFTKNTDVTRSDCPADVIKRCNITFCCEPDENILKKMVFDPKGVLDGLDDFKNFKVPFQMDKGDVSKGLVLLETIGSNLSLKINVAICDKNGSYVEAPLIGTLEMAENNSVKIIAAGNDTLFQECAQYFKVFATNTLFLGNHIGQAMDLKVVHTMMEGSINAGLKEIITLVKKKEVSPELLLRHLYSSPLSCPAIMEKAHAILQNKTTAKETTADIKALRKDMAIVTSAAGSAKFPIPTANMFNETLIFLQRENEYDELESAKAETEKLQNNEN